MLVNLAFYFFAMLRVMKMSYVLGLLENNHKSHLDFLDLYVTLQGLKMSYVLSQLEDNYKSYPDFLFHGKV